MTDKPKPGNALVETRRDIEAMTTEFAKALPRQMPSERFVRTVNTAIQLNPDLAAADRRSLMAACMKAAQDGLLPDGREGALVIYNTKTKVKDGNGREVERWVPAVQWMPMVAGLMKKARNSGEIAGISASVVFRHDHFKLIKGDDEKFEHEPNLDVDDAELTEANARGAYCIISLRDGTKIRSWRNRNQIQTARSVSKAANSLMWTKFWEEGWCKVAIRHACKFAPSSADKEGHDAFMQAATRDDDTYDFGRTAAAAKDVTPTTGGSPRSSLDRLLDAKEVAGQVTGQSYDQDTGEVDERPAAAPGRPKDERRASRAPETPAEPTSAPSEPQAQTDDPSAYDGPDGGDLLGNATIDLEPTVALRLPKTKKARDLPLTEACNSLLGYARDCDGEAGAAWITEALALNPWVRDHTVTFEMLSYLYGECMRPDETVAGDGAP